MTMARQLTATALAFSLTGIHAPRRMDPLGVITEANRAYLRNRPVSTGTTLYDGDRLSTEPQGVLRLRSRAATFYLGGESQATLRGESDDEKGTQLELAAGSLVFSSPQAAAAEILADEAIIRPAADAPTIGQITAVASKILHLYARRGSLKFSYRDESEVIAEGESYRVVLDPPDDDTAAKPDSDHPRRTPSRRRKGFLFFLIGAGAAAAAAGGMAAPSASPAIANSESPFHP